MKKKAQTIPTKTKQTYAEIPGRIPRLKRKKGPPVFEGTATVRVIDPDGHATLLTADYRVDAIKETRPEQLRAERQRLAREGKPLPSLPEESLRNKVLFVYGPQLTVTQMIAILEQELRNIKAYGSVIGRDPQGKLILERVEQHKEATTKAA